MKKYRVIGTTTVTVYKEVWANNEDEAINKAEDMLDSLTAYCGNGGMDKLIGVDDDDESVAADGYIEWNETEELEDNPDLIECPNCGELCEKIEDNLWCCEECEKYFDDDGNETFPDDADEED